MTGVLKKSISKRLNGDQPSPVQAALSAAVAGTAVAVATYRLMRN